MNDQVVAAVNRLVSELQKGWDSIASESDWISEEEAYRLLGVSKASGPDCQADHIL